MYAHTLPPYVYRGHMNIEIAKHAHVRATKGDNDDRHMSRAPHGKCVCLRPHIETILLINYCTVFVVRKFTNTNCNRRRPTRCGMEYVMLKYIASFTSKTRCIYKSRQYFVKYIVHIGRIVFAQKSIHINNRTLYVIA